MENKVYCKKCKYKYFWSTETGDYNCKVNKTHHTTPMKEYDQLMECNKVNKNNDCKKYEPTFFVSLSEKIRELRVVVSCWTYKE